jgi:hypothetical protein
MFMLKNWNSRSIVYLLLSVAGLIGTWYFNLLAIKQGRNFLADWGSTPAVSSATTDLLIAASAASIFMFYEVWMVIYFRIICYCNCFYLPLIFSI